MADSAQRVTGEQSVLQGTSITPASIASNFTDAIDLSIARRWVAEVSMATLSGGATVDFAIYGSATSSGTYAPLGTGFQITTESTGGKVFQIEFTTDSVTNVNSGYKWVKGYTACKVASAGNVTALIRGYVLRFSPGTDAATAAQTPIYPSNV